MYIHVEGRTSPGGSSWRLTDEARVPRAQATPCGICRGKAAEGKFFGVLCFSAVKIILLLFHIHSYYRGVGQWVH